MTARLEQLLRDADTTTERGQFVGVSLLDEPRLEQTFASFCRAMEWLAADFMPNEWAVPPNWLDDDDADSRWARWREYSSAFRSQGLAAIGFFLADCCFEPISEDDEVLVPVAEVFPKCAFRFGVHSAAPLNIGGACVLEESDDPSTWLCKQPAIVAHLQEQRDYETASELEACLERGQAEQARSLLSRMHRPRDHPWLLFKAISSHQVVVAEELLRYGLGVNERDPILEEDTPLMIAAAAADVEMVRLLLKFKARINMTSDGCTALDMASDEKIKEVLRGAGGLTFEELARRKKAHSTPKRQP